MHLVDAVVCQVLPLKTYTVGGMQIHLVQQVEHQLIQLSWLTQVLPPLT